LIMNEPIQVVAAVTYSPEDDLFLLLKRLDERETFPGLWEFPSGELENENIREEALRELKEETGFIGETVRAGEEFLVESKYGDFEVYPVLVLVDMDEPDLTREHSKYDWYSLDEIDELETVKGLKKDLKHVGVLDG
jgi:8-oxo-dGTP diphosphatase